ncbi:MAG: UDP-glucose 4-epimerase GalE [Eubacteriales bacterium]|nr:UDP-glucose 4-epimerase GalE [Eubacteriales bacterium]
MNVLVTGGAGYIGSHTCVEMLKAGIGTIVADNYSNSKPEVLNRIEKITGKRPAFYKADILDGEGLERIFRDNRIDAVIHFAGLKAVGESVAKPLEYYHNNVTGTLVLCGVMKKYNVRKIVFSSSATVYGRPEQVPISEDARLQVTNPYGRSKLMIEDILRDLKVSDCKWQVMILRYFNPIGAHESGLIGEDPNGIPNNLMPYITQVAAGRREFLSVFGNDYNTHDGTGVRDYIHVKDLALGHLKALEKMACDIGGCAKEGAEVYNLGTGKGYSVLDVVRAFEKASGLKIPYKIVGRRPGDIDECWADPGRAYMELGWKAEKSLEDMCRDAWNWQKNNPDGF